MKSVTWTFTFLVAVSTGGQALAQTDDSILAPGVRRQLIEESAPDERTQAENMSPEQRRRFRAEIQDATSLRVEQTYRNNNQGHPGKLYDFDHNWPF